MDQDQHHSSEEDILSSDEEDAILLTLAVNAHQQLQKKERKVWVHNLNVNRADVGQYHTIIDQLRLDEAKFFSYFRMSQNSFDELLGMVTPYIKKEDTNMRKAICPEQRLAITKVNKCFC